MKTIKFWKLPNTILKLEFDSDKSDLRLHSTEMFRWGAKTEKDYLKAEKEIEEMAYPGNGWQLYAWYDVSGYQYWMETMEETNYIQISVSFDKEDIEETEIQEIQKALDNALAKANAIENKYDFNPSPYLNFRNEK